MQVSDSVSTSVNQDVYRPNPSETGWKDHYIDAENRLRKKRRFNPAMFRTNVRLKSLRKLIAGRHPNAEPPLAMQKVYFDAALPMLVWKARKHNDRPVDSMMWASLWTPSLVKEYPPEWFYRKEATTDIKSFPTDDEFAEPLAVTYDEVQTFGLQRIGAVDKPKDQRDAERQERKRKYDRESKRQKRLEAGCKPHATVPLAQSLPWKKMGISKSTYYKRGLHLTT